MLAQLCEELSLRRKNDLSDECKRKGLLSRSTVTPDNG